jgi:methanogenic corrinoid protein MtbC1
MEGWDTYFLGANMPPESILQTVEERQAHLLAISATMTYHVGRVRELIQMLREGVSNPPRVLVGGYPFNMAAGLWQSLGADGSAPDAQGALLAAERLMA